MLTYGGMTLDSGMDFETAKANGYINGTLKDGVVSFAAGELFFTTAADLSDPQGSIYYANKNNAVNVLTLPSAVTAQAKVKAAKSVKAVKGMKFAKSKMSRNNVSKLNKNRNFMSQLNSNVKLNRK